MLDIITSSVPRRGKLFENQKRFGIKNVNLLPTISRRRDIFRERSLISLIRYGATAAHCVFYFSFFFFKKRIETEIT